MNDPAIPVCASYQREWHDGFGARGWKLDVSIGEPSVIAATAEAGDRIPTSVLVHDILDHHLCGFGIGGHRNEAMALMQLASRTGSDPRRDFRQIVDEDIMQGHCNGESLRSFLPEDLIAGLPAGLQNGKAIIKRLLSTMDPEALRVRLVEHFVEVGEAAQIQVEAHWRSLGLAYERRSAMGLALQQILSQVDAQACREQWELAHGHFLVRNRSCALVMDVPRRQRFSVQPG